MLEQHGTTVSKVLYAVDYMRRINKINNKSEVMKILEKHGATFEGDSGSICHQRGHKKPNDQVCWHKA
jgi:hypothetical protein